MHQKPLRRPNPPLRSADGKVTFNFRYQPWPEVLDWFAEQAGLSLLMESPPPGTFNYTDTRSYSPTEALDVLNGVLLTKGYTLVRHGKMLVVVNLEDGVPPNLVPDVPLAELDSRGEYELIRVVFPVWNMTPDQAAAEVQPLLGPQGKVVILAPSPRDPSHRNRRPVADDSLRCERSGATRIGRGRHAGDRAQVHHVRCRDAYHSSNARHSRPRLLASPDGSVQITKSANGEKILFRGTAQQAARLTEVLRLIDVPEAARGVNGSPQLEVYSITTADPDAVVKMLQTMLHNDPTVVLTADKEAGQVLAFATPPQQATIKATIDQMQKDAKQVDVITCRTSIRRSPCSRSTSYLAAKVVRTNSQTTKRRVSMPTSRPAVCSSAAPPARCNKFAICCISLARTRTKAAAQRRTSNTCGYCRFLARQPARRSRRSNKSGPRCGPNHIRVVTPTSAISELSSRRMLAYSCSGLQPSPLACRPRYRQATLSRTRRSSSGNHS